MSRYVINVSYDDSDSDESSLDSDEFEHRTWPSRNTSLVDDDEEEETPAATAAPVDAPLDVFTHQPVCMRCHAPFADGDPVEKSSNDVLRHAACSSRPTRSFRFQTTCSVCQSDFTDDVSVVLLDCSHVFHRACMAEWIQRGHNCPTCRWSTLLPVA